MVLRSVSESEIASGARRIRLSDVVLAASLTGPVRWLIARYGVPAGQAWRAACDACGAPLWPAACAPNGRCTTCHARLGAPPLLIEALILATAAIVALADLTPALRVAAAWWLTGAVLLGSVDALVHRLPLIITAAQSMGTVAVLAIAAAVDNRWPDLLRGALAAAVLAALLFLLCLPREGLGLGDVALCLPIGLVLGFAGWPVVALWVLVTSILVGGTGIMLLAIRRATRKTRLPLGPFMLSATVLALAAA